MLEKPPLGVALAGLDTGADRPWRTPRGAIEWAAAAGFRHVQLDATTPGLRPRELDRSGRRDVAAMLRRLGLSPSGVDLWIPPEHFADQVRGERAAAAVLAAIEWAADLSALTGGAGRLVAVTMPTDPPAVTLPTMLDRAAVCGVRIADYAWPPPEDAGGPRAVGIDPARLLLAGQNPAGEVARLGPRVAQARLSDASMVGRVAPGSRGGRLDELAYLVGVSTARISGPLVLDLRGLGEQEAAAREVVERWTAPAAG